VSIEAVGELQQGLNFIVAEVGKIIESFHHVFS